MAFSNAIHPLGPPRLLASADWSAARGSGLIQLPGGGSLQLADWQPVALHVPQGVDCLAVLPEAENASGCWLESDGRWIHAADGSRKRALRLTRQQPDVRLTFHPDAGPPRSWLLLVEDGGCAPGELAAWTHEEWESDSHQNGGKWSMEGGYWVRGGKHTPNGAPGVLTAETLTPSAGDAQVYGACMPAHAVPANWYADLRWKQKLEAAGYVVSDAPWSPAPPLETRRAQVDMTPLLTRRAPGRG